MRRTLVPSSILAAALLASVPAAADPFDLALNRLSFYDRTPDPSPTRDYQFVGGCGTSPDYHQCQADHSMFANLVNQLGGALAPALMAPARTLGYNGLYFAYEHSISGINGDASYWRRGTEGTQRDRMNTNNPTTVVRDTVPNQLFVSRLHVRKSFPYGFELGMQGSWLHESTIVALGLDIRWAPFEGFHTGIGYLPDFAVRGAVNTVVGQQQLYLTMVSVDGSFSKQIGIAGAFTLTPFIGGQALWIFGDSTVIDGTPLRSSYRECPRRHVEFQRNPMTNALEGSTLVCDVVAAPMGGGDDSRNDMVFTAARILRGRMFGGMRFRYGLLAITAEFGMDLIAPSFSSEPDSAGSPLGRPIVPTPASGPDRQRITLDDYRQWTISFGAGLSFH